MPLPPILILDARSGKRVPKTTRVKYPDGEDWSWSDWRYRIADKGGEEAILWIRSSFKPNGYWQRCPTWFGGLVWIVPS